MLVAPPADSATGTNPEPGATKDLLGKALGRLASGVFVVTTSSDGQRDGMLATFVAQVAFEPPTITVSINKQRGLLQKLTVGAGFAVNILGKHNLDVFKAFARPASDAQADRFAGLEVLDGIASGPVFAQCVSYLDCRITELLDVGDHVLAVAEVIGGQPLNLEAEPMVHLRKNGFQY